MNYTRVKHRWLRLLLLSSLPCLQIQAGPQRPNIVFILVDDMGWKELYDLSKDIGEKQNLADTNPELCKELE
jgi:hypothetical protein